MPDRAGGPGPAQGGDAGMARAALISGMLSRFRARLCAERMRMPDSPYLDWTFF